MNNDSFHYFSQLPLELRRLIWTHCLPHRIAEEDTPDFLLDGNESRQACWADRITHQNAQLPAIAFVNSESRQVTLEEGRWLDLQETTSLESIWVQPRRDVLHLNWTRLRYNVWGNADDPSSPLAMFLWRAEDLGMQPSVVAEIIHPFSLKALLDGGADDADDADDADESNSPWLLYHHGRNKDVADIAYCAESQSRLDIAMAAGTRIGKGTGRAGALRSIYQFSIPDGRGSMEKRSGMDPLRVHVAASTNGQRRHPWDGPGLRVGPLPLGARVPQDV
ncbi:predicted protein [Aspergillus terreus NIH2624]|uniref:2EXR domain-containing protein n=1 Tax=Aspergillus terreus (strain NIH 2624 / FGSC A1156) TaxID=341663 RepID=Q0C823_ASPTN|nr:uncharacterized protein ATEG_10161 [Aspergillus terreus NIH2624]EAU29610.1 predicted protein [Aspergillus terreus NIH2624]